MLCSIKSAIAICRLKPQDGVKMSDKKDPSVLSFDYFYDKEPEKYRFYKVPAVLLENPDISKALSSDAILIYSLFLSRTSLSLQNNWKDKDGRVYIHYPINDLCKILNRSSGTIKRAMDSLDSNAGGIGLIRKVRQGLGKPDRIYVMNFASPIERIAQEIKNSAESPKEGFQNRKNEDSGKSNNAIQENQNERFKNNGIDDSGISKINDTESQKTIPLYINKTKDIQIPKYIDIKHIDINKITTKLNQNQLELVANCNSLKEYIYRNYDVDGYISLEKVLHGEKRPDYFLSAQKLAKITADAVYTLLKSSKDTIRINSEEIPAGDVKLAFLCATDTEYCIANENLLNRIMETNDISNPSGYFINMFYHIITDNIEYE